jgi:diguanylate cyclase
LNQKSELSPTEIARQALRALVDRHLLPTPENYMVEYRNIEGKQSNASTSASTTSAPQAREAFQAIQGIVATVTRTVDELVDGVDTWDKDCETLIDELDGSKNSSDGSKILLSLLTPILALKKTVDQSRDELTEMRVRLDRMNENMAHFEKLSETDELTRLHNRRALGSVMQREIARAKRTNKPLSLTILDIDHFKTINDRHGHPIGDQALTHVASLIVSGIREVDFACRYGGEEFIVLLPDTESRGAHYVLDRIRSRIQTSPLSIDGQNIWLCASVGVAQMREAESGEQLLTRADIALYQAKRNGRNQIVIADP